MSLVKVTSLWNLPAELSEGEFEKWYLEKHVPEAKKIPGLRKYVINKVHPKYQAESRYYRMVELCFDSVEELEAALQSKEWQEAFKDAAGKVADFIRLYFVEDEVPLG